MKKLLPAALLIALAACGDPPAVHATAPIAVKVAAAPETRDADSELAQRVMRAFEAAELHGVEAISTGGIVTLWGTTVDAADRLRASDIAARIDGVKAVENRLEVVSGS